MSEAPFTARLMSFEVFFGRHEYTYVVSPPLKSAGASWSRVRVEVSWGLGFPVMTRVLAEMREDGAGSTCEQEVWRVDGEPRIEAQEALAKLGYHVLACDPYTLFPLKADAGWLSVVKLAQEQATAWLDQPDSYWFYRLSEEVGDLGASLARAHPQTPEDGMREVAAIAINWLAKRQAAVDAAEANVKAARARRVQREERLAHAASVNARSASAGVSVEEAQ
jgi:hypothetical protein